MNAIEYDVVYLGENVFLDGEQVVITIIDVNLFSIDDIFKLIRRVLSDTNKVRFADSVLFNYLNDALRLLRAKRTDVWLDDNGDLTSFNKIISINESLPIGDEWKTYVMNYILCSCFSEMSESKASGARALKYLSIYQQQLKEI